MSIILDGPTFTDELKRQPQELLEQNEIESLRLVPGKSAARGVHTIYFKPKHRDWALVRLALRYRWILEIQLNRGMSGERQLIQQGFTPDDLDFLFEIIPEPPEKFSPIVYDMMWLVATYDEYLVLTKSMVEQRVFTPGELLDETDGVSLEDSGFITRFLRSHLIERKLDLAKRAGNHGKSKRTDLSVDLDARYVVTKNGKESLDGILQEYERIFEKRQFEPLFINPDLDPHKHLRAFNQDTHSNIELEIDDIRESEGLLGEIAKSFTSVDTKSAADTENSSSESSTASQSQQESAEAHVQPRVHNPKEEGYPLEPNEASKSFSQEATLGSESRKSDSVGTEVESTETVESENADEFTRGEIVDAAVGAASIIHDERMTQTRKVKERAWQSIELRGRHKSELWNRVAVILEELEDVHGRPGGRMWMSTR